MFENICEDNYDKISEKILDSIIKLTQQIQIVSNIITDLIQKLSTLDDLERKNFVDCFECGKYYHFRSQGFMENLVISKYYSSQSICYWYEELFITSTENLMKSYSIIDNLCHSAYLSSDNNLNELFKELKNMISIINSIEDLTREYNLYCII